jgi:hypothetical protein
MIEQLRRLFGQAPDEYALDVQRVPNLATYQAHVARMGATHRERWLLELDLCKSGETFKTPGKCYPCRKDVVFTTDFEYSSAVVNGQRIPNWRERVLCSCQLNNRTRASIHILEGLLGANKRSSIYIAEQVTPLYEVLRKRFPKLVGSEYLGTKVPFGKTDERGVRNESITKLTLADASFDYVLNFDVLEHVPEPEQGIREIHRVLRPGGHLLLSVPFLPMSAESQVRARVLPDGSIEHLMEPQYHGDPVSDAGCLCFQDFGWELLDQLRASGFRSAEMILYWSQAFGYYGVEQMMIVARK